jgi:hypothetical protein
MRNRAVKMASFGSNHDTAGLKSPLPMGGGQPLASLDASELKDRFYRWRGASGREYICSIFTKDELAVVTGFSGAVIIGVAKEGPARRAVSVISSVSFACPGDQDMFALDVGSGADEWHVHFSKDDSCLRDLAASLLH